MLQRQSRSFPRGRQRWPTTWQWLQAGAAHPCGPECLCGTSALPAKREQAGGERCSWFATIVVLYRQISSEFLVTTAPAAADAPAAIGSLTREPHMFAERSSHRVTIRAHGIIRQSVSLPWPDIYAPRAAQQDSESTEKKSQLE